MADETVLENEEVEIVVEEDSSEETPKKKFKLGMGSLIGAVLVFGFLGLYVFAMIKGPPPVEPLTFEEYSQTAEAYSAEIVRVHNDLLGVDPRKQWNPGDKVSGVERSFATSELNSRIKTMNEYSDKLLALEFVDATDTAPPEIDAFAAFIKNEWAPYWEEISAWIKEAKTAEDAFLIFDSIKDKIEVEPLGDDMRKAFYGLTDAGRQLGWSEDSYRARIK
jgi:hypothetical protein